MVNKKNTAYTRKGKSENAIIFLHHNSGSSLTWQEILNDDYFKNYELICIDIPGHGKSVNSLACNQDYTLKNLSSIILETIISLGLKSYIVVAASFGANLIGEIADQLIDCKGFFLVGPSILGADVTPNSVLLPFEHSYVLFTPQPTENEIDSYIDGLIYHFNRKLADGMKKDFRDTDPKFREQLGIEVKNSTWTDEIDNIKKTNLQIALVYGKKERIVNSNNLLDKNLDLWKNKIHLIDNAGHLAHLDQPKIFGELLLEFANDVL